MLQDSIIQDAASDRPSVQRSVWERIEHQRYDLWISKTDDVVKPLAQNQWFSGPFSQQRDTKWREWKEQNLQSFQQALFERMILRDKFQLIGILPHDKHSLSEHWGDATPLTVEHAYEIFRTGGNYAVKCGPKFNLIIVDIDPIDTLPAFWRNCMTLTSRTGKGFHLYFRHTRAITEDQGEAVYNFMCQSIGHRRDTHCCGSTLRFGSGFGSYALVPMSIHPNGSIYQFIDWAAPIRPFGEVLQRVVRQSELTES